MAKITWGDRQHTEQMGDAFPSFNRAFIPELNRFQTGMTNAMRNGLTLLDNMQAAKVALPNCTHGSPYTFVNPLYPAIPLFFAPYLSMLTNGQSGLGFVGGNLPVTPSQGGKFLTVTINFQPPSTGSGSLGERISALRQSASTVPFVTTGVPVDIGSINLTPGAYEVSFGATFNTVGGVATTGTQNAAWVHTVSATDPVADNGDNRVVTPTMAIPSSALVIVLAGYRVTPAVNTTYYFSAKQNFTAAPGSVFGRVSAVRAAPYLTGYAANVTGILYGG